MIVTYEMLKSNLNLYQGRIISYGSDKRIRYSCLEAEKEKSKKRQKIRKETRDDL